MDRLNHEANLRNYAEQDWKQRLAVKNWAIWAGCAVSFFMGLFLFAALHQVTLFGPVHPAAMVAIIVAPTTSITTVTVMLFIGAFRKFDDNDPAAIAAAAKDILAAASRAGGGP